MFDQLVVSGATQTKTHKSWTVLISTLVQVGIVIVMILIPLIYTEALPKGMLTTFLAAPPPPPPPPPPAAAIKVVKPQVHLIHNGQLTTPTVIPKKVSRPTLATPRVSSAASPAVPRTVCSAALSAARPARTLRPLLRPSPTSP